MLPMIEANDLSAGGDRLLSVSDSLFSTNQSIAAFQTILRNYHMSDIKKILHGPVEIKSFSSRQF